MCNRITSRPNTNSHAPTLRLIDFGCAIDMNFFEPDTQFRKVIWPFVQWIGPQSSTFYLFKCRKLQIIQTDGFTCPEMLEGRPWSYQTDIFCIAGTIHVMLFGEYMQVVNKFGQYEIKQKLPRWVQCESRVKNECTNITCIDLPRTGTWRNTFGRNSLRNFWTLRICTICPICSISKRKSMTKPTIWNRNCNHKFERYRIFFTSDKTLHHTQSKQRRIAPSPTYACASYIRHSDIDFVFFRKYFLSIDIYIFIKKKKMKEKKIQLAIGI